MQQTIISENAMSNSNKPTRFAYLQNLSNQSMLHGVHVKEMTKKSTFKNII